MIKLVVCEDNQNEMTHLKTLLKKDVITHFDLDVTYFLNPKLVIDDQTILTHTDVFILDILMPEFSGIELAKVIRKHNKDAVIIFLTASKEYALDAYEMLAIRYLIKPLKASELNDALAMASHLVKKKTVKYQIETRTERITLNLLDIKWIEYRDHVLYFTTTESVIKSKFYRTTFSKTIPSLFEHQSFILSHRSYLVNLNHVLKMVPDGFIMNNQAFIPISKNRRTLVRKQYLDYTLRGGY